ncbi:MAG: MFS transporter [Planctomycetaceae bacterium]
MTPSDASVPGLDRRGRLLVLAAAFLGWMFAGWEMSLLPLAARSVTIGLLQNDPEHADWVQLARTTERVIPANATSEDDTTKAAVVERLNAVVGKWFTRYIAAFLLGAALGGWVFGWLGDRSGRVMAMAVSIVWYSGFTGLSAFANSPLQVCILRFIACMGVGGMWPAGVALVTEAWPDVSRPTLAGLIGMSANVGIALLGVVVKHLPAASDQLQLTPDSWRWIMVAGLVPIVLGGWVWWFVPESPVWMAGHSAQKNATPVRDVLRPPLLTSTIVGIMLGAIPLLGSWGSQKWMQPWAGEVGARIGQETLKADVQAIWAYGAAIGSLCGGWLATLVGRRTSYFLASLGSLLLAQYLFTQLQPSDSWQFMFPVFALGIVGTIFYGWLPLYLPQMFPAQVRATGSGVAFNSGRIVSAILVLATSAMVVSDYAAMGSRISWVYAAGMIAAFLIPPQPETSASEESGQPNS